MIDAATAKPAPYEIILVHSFSRFFRHQFLFEFYVRRLAKLGVRVVRSPRSWAATRTSSTAAPNGPNAAKSTSAIFAGAARPPPS